MADGAAADATILIKRYTTTQGSIMERNNNPGDYLENQNQEPTPVCVLPEELKARLEKADGHINAAGRKLWYETERGFWSGDQAKARLAEAWLWLRGEPVQPLPLERYLKKDVFEQRLQVWSRPEIPEPIAAALAELATAEQAIRAEPFPVILSTPLSDGQRKLLYAGIDRQNHYKKALYELQLAVEDVVAERYVNLRPGDWVRLPDRAIGRVLTIRGLIAWIVAPKATVESLLRRYSLRIARIERIERPQSPPISAPGYYWLVQAHDRLCETRRFIENVDLLGVANISRTLLETLDAAAKAWWITFAPVNDIVTWSNASGRQILELPGRAPPFIADTLNDCRRRQEAFSLAMPKQLTGWEAEISAILHQFEQALAALEALIAPEIDLDEGDWVAVFPNAGRGRIVQRQGGKLVIDRGRQGILEASMFHPFVQRIPAPVDAAILVSQPWHRRWLWFACHPQARGNRQICPCCGLPGIRNDGGKYCRLCGWRHDGGDFDPGRLSATHDDLTLALGRRRFGALGYAALPNVEAGWPTWLDPLVLVRKRRLIAALDALVNDDTAEDPERLTRIETLWTEYEAVLGSATRAEEEIPDHERRQR